MRRSRKAVYALLAALLLAVLLTACSDTEDVAVRQDQLGCNFNDSTKRGYDLDQEITSSDGSVTVHKDTQLITIPLSNRFVNISNTSNRDPGMPRFIEGRSSDGVAVWMELQIRFQFVTANGCDWYLEHGRRNAESGGPYRTEARPPAPPGLSDDDEAPGQEDCANDLSAGNMGFNVRGCMTPWFTWLAENFGIRSVGLVPPLMADYGWEQLTQNQRLDDGELTWTTLGATIGTEFTTSLNQFLTGTDDNFYFCGVSLDPDVDEGVCPDMEVEIIDIHTVNPDLENNLEELTEASELRDNAVELSAVLAELDAQRAGLEASQQLELDRAVQDFLLGNDEALRCAALAQIGVDCTALTAAQNGIPNITGNEQVIVGGGQSSNEEDDG